MLKFLTSSASRLALKTGSFTGKRARQLKDDKSGVAALEMAFIFPVMLVLYFGLVDITNLLSANRRVTLTSSTIGDLVTQASGTVTEAELEGYFNAAAPIMDPLDTTQMGLELFAYSLVGGAAQLDWEQRKTGGTSCGATPSATTEMVTLMQAGTGLVLARVCYTWQPLSSYVIGSDPVTVSDEMVLRPRQSSSIECDDC